MDNEAQFLAAINANPKDLVLRFVYADWLEECGDARSEYLRIDGQLQELVSAAAAKGSLSNPKIRQLRSQLKKVGETLDADWVALIDALRPNFVSCCACRQIIPAEQAIDTNPRNYRKLKSSRYCRRCYEDAIRSQLHRSFDTPTRRSSAATGYHGYGGGDE